MIILIKQLEEAILLQRNYSVNLDDSINEVVFCF